MPGRKTPEPKRGVISKLRKSLAKSGEKMQRAATEGALGPKILKAIKEKRRESKERSKRRSGK